MGQRATRAMLSLAGRWRFSLDRADVGVGEKWFSRELDDELDLPGSLQAQGFGDDIAVDTPWTGDIYDRSWFVSPQYARYREPGQIKVPFWLQPDKHYVGVAWYQREIDIPAEWSGKRVVLVLERPHWGTQVWLDDREVGAGDSLSTPHVFVLGTAISSGRHRLTIRVDNRLLVDVGKNAHSVSDHTQTNWNGIVGEIILEATDPVWLEDAQIYPDVKNRQAIVECTIGNATGKRGRGRLRLSAQGYNTETPHTPPPCEVEFEISGAGATHRAESTGEAQTMVRVVYPLGPDAHLWDEFDPALYRLTLQLEADVDQKTYADSRVETFGLRELVAEGTQFAVNGRKTFLRGTLECCIFPLTGYPPTDVEAWKRILRIARAHGLNSLRFHSWCPPQAAFVAADEMGFYFQVECAAWARIGQGQPIDDWLYAEGERITRRYGNHPSFVMMASGNEPGGNHEAFLAKWVSYWKERDPRRLHTSGAGWPVIPENDFHVTPEPRIYHWGRGPESRINARPPETMTDYRSFVAQWPVPVISHEIGQWCVFPNFDEIPKYTGVLKAKNFEIFRDLLEANHMGDQAGAFLMASGKLQVLCYKEEIESALRTPGFGGFQLLDLHDFPGQGTALVGILDPFWDSKPYVSPEEFRRFCNATVVLARLPKRVFRLGETLEAGVEVAHYGPKALQAGVSWNLVDENGTSVAAGTLPARLVETGGLTSFGSIRLPLDALEAPARYRLVAGLVEAEGPGDEPVEPGEAGGTRGSDGTGSPGAAGYQTPLENDWDVWVYPPRVEIVHSAGDADATGHADAAGRADAADVTVSEALDDRTLQVLRNGGRVLLLPPAGSIDTDVETGFSTVFWNTAWTNGQPPHTLGILCDPEHPVFQDFPTQYHTDWQWWELLSTAQAMVLDRFPPQLRPLVQLIDTWFRSRRVGLLFEAEVLGGRLMVCSMDLQKDLDERIVARQLRYSVLRYMSRPEFQPSVRVDAETIAQLFR